MIKIDRDELYTKYFVEKLSLNECAKYFNKSMGSIRYALDKFKIPKHEVIRKKYIKSDKQKDKERNKIPKKRTYNRVKKRPTFDPSQYYDVIDYYKEHSIRDTQKKFNLPYKKIVIICKYFNFVKTKDQIKATYETTKIGKHGSLENAYDTMVSNKRKTEIEKYGSIGNCYDHIRKQMMKSTKYRCDCLGFDSFPELALYKYAKDHNEDIEREPVRFSYTYGDSEHYYYPDFRYKGELIEIKGDHLIDSDGNLLDFYHNCTNEVLEAKAKCMYDNNIKIITSKDYNLYIDWFNEHYNKEEFMIK